MALCRLRILKTPACASLAYLCRAAVGRGGACVRACVRARACVTRGHHRSARAPPERPARTHTQRQPPAEQAAAAASKKHSPYRTARSCALWRGRAGARPLLAFLAFLLAAGLVAVSVVMLGVSLSLVCTACEAVALMRSSGCRWGSAAPAGWGRGAAGRRSAPGLPAWERAGPGPRPTPPLALAPNRRDGSTPQLTRKPTGKQPPQQ